MKLRVVLIALLPILTLLITNSPMGVDAQASANLQIFISDHCGKHAPSGANLKVNIINSNGTPHTYGNIDAYNDTHSLLNVTLAEGNYTVEVMWMDVPVARTQITLVNNTTITILTETTLVKFRIRDYGGDKGLGDAILRLSREGKDMGTYSTNSKGEVEVLLPYGDYIIEEIKWRGRTVLEDRSFSVDGSRCIQTVNLKCRVGGIRVLITDEGGIPVDRDKVKVTLLRYDRVIEGPVQPTEYGYVTFDLLLFDYYTIIVDFRVHWNGKSSELEVYRKSIELSEEALGDRSYVEEHIVIPLIKNVEIHITDSEGQLLDNVELRAIAGQYVSRPAPRGVVRFGYLLKRSYSYEIVWNSKIWGTRLFKGTIEVNSTVVNIRLPLYTLRVDLRGDRCPEIEEFSIKLYDENWKLIGDTQPFKTLLKGTYHLKIVWHSEELGNITLVKKTIEIEKSYTLPVEYDFYRVSFKIVDPSEQPISNSTVNIVLPNERVLVLETDHEGKTKYLLLPKGAYHITVKYRGVIIHDQDLEVNSDGVISLIGMVQDLILKVVNRLGNTIQGARVKLMIELADGTLKEIGEEYTDISGIAVFKCIPRYARAEKYILIVNYQGREYSFTKPFLADETTVEWKVSLDVVVVLFGNPLSLLEFLLLVSTCLVVGVISIVVILRLRRKREFETIFEEYARRRRKPKRRLIPW
ncbi:MAG: hypothetical protein DRJ49_06135, partial [Thermoprotei archaeon]